MRGNILVGFIGLSLPVTICACNSVSSAPNVAEVLVKKCIVEKAGKNVKIEFGRIEKVADVVSPAEQKNGISEKALIRVNYISSSDGKSWTDSSQMVYYKEKLSFGLEIEWLKRKQEKNSEKIKKADQKAFLV